MLNAGERCPDCGRSYKIALEDCPQCKIENELDRSIRSFESREELRKAVEQNNIDIDERFL